MDTEHAKGRLARRFEELATCIERFGGGLALLALGSGAEPERVDVWSDLDFFVVVQPGQKGRFLDDLTWLEAAPLVWCHRNTPDGYKALYEDELLAEFAVFEPHELAGIPFAPGQIVWQVPGFDASICQPQRAGGFEPSDVGWLVGEILSNLFIGLGRWHRGERLAAFRAIQGWAVDGLVKLAEQVDGISAEGRDPFTLSRRVERRNPRLAPELEGVLLGVDRCPASAVAILEAVARRVEVPEAMRKAVLARC